MHPKDHTSTSSVFLVSQDAPFDSMDTSFGACDACLSAVSKVLSWDGVSPEPFPWPASSQGTYLSKRNNVLGVPVSIFASSVCVCVCLYVKTHSSFHLVFDKSTMSTVVSFYVFFNGIFRLLSWKKMKIWSKPDERLWHHNERN
jgi:hypothetical protein